MFLPARRRGEVARRHFRTKCESVLSATEGSLAAPILWPMTPPPLRGTSPASPGRKCRRERDREVRRRKASFGSVQRVKTEHGQTEEDRRAQAVSAPRGRRQSAGRPDEMGEG